MLLIRFHNASLFRLFSALSILWKASYLVSELLLIDVLGENPVQFVALRYQQGEAAMGRVWKNKDDKIEVRVHLRLHSTSVQACFSWSKYCLLNPDGPILVLCELPTELVGFTYSWQVFKALMITSLLRVSCSFRAFPLRSRLRRTKSGIQVGLYYLGLITFHLCPSSAC